MRIATTSQLFNQFNGYTFSTYRTLTNLPPKKDADGAPKKFDDGRTIYQLPVGILGKTPDGEIIELRNFKAGILTPNVKLEPGHSYQAKGLVFVTPWTNPNQGNRIQYSLILEDIEEVPTKA